MTQQPSVPFKLSMQKPMAGAYFLRSKYVKIGRKVYICGYRTDGNVANQQPLFMVWDLDAMQMTELPPPPCSGAAMRDLQIQLSQSHGKVVFPFTMGPEGEINGIHVYDPATATWATDDQRPDEASIGPFIGNSFVSLPDGRVAFAGGAEGRQQRAMWFYEAI